ncbi:MAG: S46 family peptidase [Melioribacteraceae bacterium]|nr:S46 family peptidase [Melioribacteraceae bacterium]
MKKLGSVFVISILLFFAGCSATQDISKNKSFQYFNPDTVKSHQFDTGKMWTFEDAPLDYFDETYSFKPDAEWLEHVQKSSLKFAKWCSASFVSGDGLIMTNHHCVDFITSRYEEEGEDIHEAGFYAPTLGDERKVPMLYVDQLVFTKNVTAEIFAAIDSGKTETEKAKLRIEKTKELEQKYSDEKDLICKVTSLYHGGKYSIYGYKRYNDVRAVYVNESQMGLYGGDPDNFTYPRYNPDFAFMRVYDDDGNPLKTKNYFKWSKNGAEMNEPIFVVGNPGSTSRLKTMSQLEFMRDYTYRNLNFITNRKVKYYNELIKEDTANARKYETNLFRVANGAKVFKYSYQFLTDEYSMARKRDFENKFKSAVQGDENLNKLYGHLWDGIEVVNNEYREYAAEKSAYTISKRSSSDYFLIAKDLIEFARELKKPEEDRGEEYKGTKLDTTIQEIFPSDFNMIESDKELRLQADFMMLNLGSDNPLMQKMYGGRSGDDAMLFVKNNSKITSAKDVETLARTGADAILNSDDPFINFILTTEDRLSEIIDKQEEAKVTEKVFENELGRALFEVYGTTIPPDATFTSRISDGELKSYEYNGTIAPVETTFYGMYDRYYSNYKKYPWGLPDRWLNPKEGFDMSTQYNFISTNDITGGSSGSPVINKEAEIIGVAFDGNIESIPGNFLYNQLDNRMITVSSKAMIQILRYIGDAERIADELETGSIPEKYRVAENPEATNETEETIEAEEVSEK